ncbi:hypothetical protein D3C76_1351800 [compost metagenome]
MTRGTFWYTQSQCSQMISCSLSSMVRTQAAGGLGQYSRRVRKFADFSAFGRLAITGAIPNGLDPPARSAQMKSVTCVLSLLLTAQPQYQGRTVTYGGQCAVRGVEYKCALGGIYTYRNDYRGVNTPTRLSFSSCAVIRTGASSCPPVAIFWRPALPWRPVSVV